MLVPWPPTISPLTPAGLASSRFIAAVVKPEAFTSIMAATVAQKLSEQASLATQMALSDRDGIDVSSLVVQMDDGFEGLVFKLAARELIGSRGYDRAAAADEEVVKLADRAWEVLLMMAPGAGGKRVTPQYVLAAAVARQDSVRVNSQERSDDWARRRRLPPLGGVG